MELNEQIIDVVHVIGIQAEPLRFIACTQYHTMTCWTTL